MKIPIFFIILNLLSSVTTADIPPVSLTFQQLEEHKITEIHNGQSITLRGFLYRDHVDQWILCSTPNIKTCCLHKQNHLKIFLKDFSFSQPLFQVVHIGGKIMKNGDGYILENAYLVEETYTGTSSNLLMGGGLLALFGSILIIIKKKNYI